MGHPSYMPCALGQIYAVGCASACTYFVSLRPPHASLGRHLPHDIAYPCWRVLALRIQSKCMYIVKITGGQTAWCTHHYCYSGLHYIYSSSGRKLRTTINPHQHNEGANLCQERPDQMKPLSNESDADITDQ